MKKNILKLFLYKDNLKFSDIERLLNERSNKLSYHLSNMVKKGILSKEADYYRLSKDSEHMIPYVTEKQAVIPVVLIILEKNKQIFLHERTKRPYQNKLGLPGGRIILGENIKKATERIMKEKFGTNCKFKKINSVHLEHVKKEDKIIHSFLLILVTATTKKEIKYMDILRNKNKIIKSDYLLIKNNLNSTIEIGDINSVI